LSLKALKAVGQSLFACIYFSFDIIGGKVNFSFSGGSYSSIPAVTKSFANGLSKTFLSVYSSSDYASVGGVFKHLLRKTKPMRMMAKPVTSM